MIKKSKLTSLIPGKRNDYQRRCRERAKQFLAGFQNIASTDENIMTRIRETFGKFWSNRQKLRYKSPAIDLRKSESN